MLTKEKRLRWITVQVAAVKKMPNSLNKSNDTNKSVVYRNTDSYIEEEATAPELHSEHIEERLYWICGWYHMTWSRAVLSNTGTSNASTGEQRLTNRHVPACGAKAATVAGTLKTTETTFR